MTNRKQFVRDALVIIITTVILLATIEGVIRTAYFVRNSAVEVVILPYTAAQDWGVVPPWMDGLRILQEDPVLLWKNRAGVKRSYLDVYGPANVEADRVALVQQFLPRVPKALRGNPVWQVSINSQGFRAQEFPREKPVSSFRIACLGDSWTFGANVNQERAYPQRLASRLEQAHRGAGFEVLNLGVMGYTSRQGLELLRRYVLDLHPDLVLIGFAMNDAIVPGWRDEDAFGRPEGAARPLSRALDYFESYKLVSYWQRRFRYHPWTIGDYLEQLARADGTPDAVWTGRDATEVADYDALESITRVSPRDYEKNLVTMIDLVRSRGAEVVLLFNELFNTPYRKVVEKVALAKNVPWVDSKGLIDEARRRAERALEERLDLRPPEVRTADPKGLAEVVFRVYADRWPVSKALYIAGNHPSLGDIVPNLVALRDDGAHRDQRNGDGVWSYAASFEPGTRLYYVYTNSGREGEWEGVDIPDLRRLNVPSDGTSGPIYLPIETFGAFALQADGWHTNGDGYELIAQAVVGVLNQHPKVREHLGRHRTDGHE